MTCSLIPCYGTSSGRTSLIRLSKTPALLFWYIFFVIYFYTCLFSAASTRIWKHELLLYISVCSALRTVHHTVSWKYVWDAWIKSIKLKEKTITGQLKEKAWVVCKEHYRVIEIIWKSQWELWIAKSLLTSLISLNPGMRLNSLNVSKAKKIAFVVFIGWINNKVLLYRTGNCIQYPVINYNGKE